MNMNWQKTRHHATLLATIAASVVGWATNGLAQDMLRVDDLVVVLIDSVDVAATETGVIAELNCREGDAVKVGQPLGRLDDRQAKLAEKLAITQSRIAAANADNGLATELAEKKLAHQQQLAKQHDVLRSIAEQKAENEIRVLAAKKAEEVAKNDLDRANRARRQFVDSVSRSEIDGLTLSYERCRLETQQAGFDRQMDRLNANSESEAAAAFQLSVEQSKIQLDQAIADQKIAQLQNELQQQQLAIAELAVRQHGIFAPIEGVVVERIRGTGEWVQRGDTVVRVVRLNQLRAEGFVDAAEIATLRSSRTVSVITAQGDSESTSRSGKIVFISPEIDPVNNEVRFWVEFQNPKQDILPGMRVSVQVGAP
jgi:multidrug efflux pump subunit AcrA (membrane-fusion protein)